MKKVYLDESLCKLIKDARIKKGLTIRQLAVKIGKSEATCCRLENFKCIAITEDTARVLEEVLDIVIVSSYGNGNIGNFIKEVKNIREDCLAKEICAFDGNRTADFIAYSNRRKACDDVLWLAEKYFK